MKKSIRQNINKKVSVITIHSLAGSGASLLVRALATSPDIFMLNQVSPAGWKLAGLNFNPIDPLSQALVLESGNLKLANEVHITQFANRLQPIIDHCRVQGLTLLIRDFSHADYFIEPQSCTSSLARALETLEDEIVSQSIMFMRYPFASYLSAKANRLIDTVPNYNDYCRLLGCFLDSHKGMFQQRYEDLVVDPVVSLGKICEKLDLDFSKVSLNRFSEVHIGDSYRHYSDGRVIHPKLMRAFGEVVRDSVRKSSLGANLCKQLKYPLDPVEYARNCAARMLQYDPSDARAQQAYSHWQAILDGGEQDMGVK